MRYFKLGSYQISLLFIVMLVLAIVGPVVIALTYLWATRTVDLVIEEPLLVTSFPAALTTHPGENRTLNVTIANSAIANYSVTLSFTLNDTNFQQQYATFSNYTYTIMPGTNNITAWVAIAKKAPPAMLSLSVQFYRQ